MAKRRDRPDARGSSVRRVTNYQRGRALEYKIKNQLEEEGYLVLRTAGSHGLFDLIALDRPFQGKGVVRFIQLKRKREGEEIHDEVSYEAEVKEEFWVIPDKRKVKDDGGEG